MNQNLKISIITPSFNQGEFIEDAINCVLNQNYKNFEHIIIDNCSNDNTINILKKYPHLKWVSEPDEGQSDAINKGFLKATGNIIGWLNADDYYLPDTFNKVTSLFQDSRLDAIYSNVKFVNDQGTFMRNLKSHIPLNWLAYFYVFIQSTSFFFRKRIIDDGYLLDKKLNLNMDMDFFARLLNNHYCIKYINDYFACFRWHQSNKSNVSSSTTNNKRKEVIYIINKNTRFKIKPSGFNLILLRLIAYLIVKPTRQILKLIPVRVYYV